MQKFNRYEQPVSGHFGQHGGRFVAETLMHALEELAALYDAARIDPEFQAELYGDLEHFHHLGELRSKIARRQGVLPGPLEGNPLDLLSPHIVESAPHPSRGRRYPGPIVRNPPVYLLGQLGVLGNERRGVNKHSHV